MTAEAKQIRRIVVAGGGIAGWTAAATLRRRVPAVEVSILASPPPPDALSDRIGSTLPSAVQFHSDIGLDETDLLLRTGGGFRLGTSFEGWAEGRAPYIHSYGEYGRALGAAPFHHHWIRASGSAAFDDHSPAAAMARHNRFVHPAPDPASPFSGFEYGLQLDPVRYRAYLRAYALHLGVSERAQGISGVELRSDGFIEGLRLGDGSRIEGDLFIDCTGPAAALHAPLSDGFEEWSAWLPCDRILFADGAPAADLPVLDRAVAIQAGWRWQAARPGATTHALIYSSAHLSDGKAERTLRSATAAEAAEPPVQIRSGRRANPWLRNCVAIGDSAVSVEPLETPHLHLVHSALDRLVAMLPDRECAPVEIAEYNRQSTAEADRVRDFLILHYRTARRPKQDFWRAAASAEPPPSVAHTLELFAERGTLPFYEEETFPRDSWLSVLIGQGVIPRRTDPVADQIPVETAQAAMATLRDTIAATIPRLPTHSAYLQGLSARARR